MRLKQTSKYLRLQFKLIKMVVSQLRRIVASFIYFAWREITAQGLLSLSRKWPTSSKRKIGAKTHLKHDNIVIRLDWQKNICMTDVFQ